MSLLALDLGQGIGWVRGKAVGPMEHGVIMLPTTTDLGLWLAVAEEKMRPLFRGVTAIAVEKPFLGESYYPARKLISLMGIVYYSAHHRGLGKSDITEIENAKAKLTLAGHGRADKNQMIAAAEQRTGLPGWSEHDADALGIFWVWHFGAAEPISKAKTRSSKAVVVKP